MATLLSLFATAAVQIARQISSNRIPMIKPAAK